MTKIRLTLRAASAAAARLAGSAWDAGAVAAAHRASGCGRDRRRRQPEVRLERLIFFLLIIRR